MALIRLVGAGTCCVLLVLRTVNYEDYINHYGPGFGGWFAQLDGSIAEKERYGRE